MEQQKKNRKPLIVGVIAVVVILAILLALLLTQCTGGRDGDDDATGQTTTVTAEKSEGYKLYWNVDRALYDGKSEAGMSSRTPEEDGYFHVLFAIDGEQVELLVADRKTVNSIDVKDVMGLVFDDNGIVIDVIDINDMPCEKAAWQFYVQSVGGNTIKANSSESFNGMEILLEATENTGIYDMTGLTGPVGCVAEPINYDRILGVKNEEGELTHVFIYSRPNYMLTHEAECQHCGKVVTWYEWTKDNAMPLNTGHYQLMNDIQLTGQPAMAEDAKICLDLNGVTVNNKPGSRCYAMFNPGTTLAIMDTSEEQDGRFVATGTGDQGMCLWLRYGVCYMYAGIMDASEATTKISGTSVALQANTYLYMYGGEIIGGTATYTHNTEKNTYGAGVGGAMYVAGKFVMEGGVIRDGFAESKITYKNGDPVWNRGFGGNIFAASGSVIELNGGVIKNGVAGNLGGNIYMDGTAELTINGTEIYGGTISGKGKNGGSIFAGGKTKIMMNGGLISGGTSRNCGGNVYFNGEFIMAGGVITGGRILNYTTGKLNENAASRNVFSVNGDFYMYGGTIYGGFQAIDTKAGENPTIVLLSGYATINSGKEGLSDLTLTSGGDGITVYVGTMLDGATVGVTTSTGIFTEPCKEHNLDNFYSNVEGADIVYYNGCLALGKLECICGAHGRGEETHINGCDGVVYLWSPWTSSSSLPSSSGKYYLTKNVTTTNQTVVKASQDVWLDLNGYDVTYDVPAAWRDGFRLYRAENGGKLRITDTTLNPGTMTTIMPTADEYQGNVVKETVVDEETGEETKVYYTTEEMEAVWANGNFGMLLWVRGGEITVHNGIFEGSHLSGNKNGLIVAVGNNTVTDEESGEKTTYYGTLNMYGGEIRNGTLRGQGNVRVEAGATLNLYGGTVTGGRADCSGLAVDNGIGGNIYVEGTMNMYGGTVSNGYARMGTNGGGHGGNIAVGNGTLTATGGTIIGGDANNGGNICTISTNAVIVLDGVQVLDGTAVSLGGNIAVNVRNNKRLEILGDTVVSGGYANNGGNLAINLFVANNNTPSYVIDGATISDGQAKNIGGNIYLHNTSKTSPLTLTMKSGLVSGGECGVDTDENKNGGSIYINTAATFVLDGGEITGGTGAKQGGNIYVATSTSLLTINGGTISDGSTYDCGGNIHAAAGGKVIMTGGTVVGGYRNDRNGAQTSNSNIYLVNGHFEMSGGEVVGGIASCNTKAGGCTVKLTGDAVISVNEGNFGYSLNKYPASTTEFDIPYIEVSDLSDEASIAVSNAGFVTTETDEANADNFVSTLADTYPVYLENRVFMGATNCICGSTDGNHIGACDGTQHVWTPWTSTSSLPTTSGYYYLTANVTDGGHTLKGVTEDMDIVIDLNGKTVTSNGWRMYSLFDTTTTYSINITIADNSANRDGKIVGPSKAQDQGSIVWLRSASQSFSMYGGIIDVTNTQLKKYEGIAICSSGDVYLYRGTIIGGKGSEAFNGGEAVAVYANRTLVIGEDMVITAPNGGSAIYVGSNTKIDLTTRQTAPETPWTISTAGGTFTTGWNEEWEISDFFVSGNDLEIFLGEDGELFAGKAYCVCGAPDGQHFGGCTGELLLWQPWTSTTTLPGSTAGNYYLTDDVTLSDQTVVKTNVSLDLNGHNVTFNVPVRDDGYRMIRTQDGATLNITDCSGGTVGTMTLVMPDLSTVTNETTKTALQKGNQGMLLWIWGGTTMNIYNGVLDGSQIAATQKDGATVEASGNLNVYGGTIKCGSIGWSSNIKITASGTMNITGGTVVGGKANNAGAIGVYGTLTMSGGTVTGGVATNQGGNIRACAGSTVTVTGGAIENGTAPNGGNIYIEADADVTIQNATVSGGIATATAAHAKGGNIYSLGDLVLDGATVTGGTAQSAGKVTVGETTSNYYSYGGNIYMDGSATLTMQNKAVVSGGLSNSNGSWAPGGNIHMDGKSSTTITDSTVTGGTASEAQNIYVNSSTKLVLNSGKIENTVSGTNSIMMQGGTFEMKGGEVVNTADKARNINSNANGTGTLTITGGTVSGGKYTDGGNIYVSTKLTLNMSAGTVTGGEGTGKGGNIYVAGTMNLSGTAVVENGKIDRTDEEVDAAYGGNICAAGGGTLNMTGGTVRGGYVRGGTKGGGLGGNIVADGTVNLTGGVIENGDASKGGNVGSNATAGVIKMDGVTVQNGKAVSEGGNLMINVRSITSCTIEEGTVITGGQAGTNGGNIAMVTWAKGGQTTATITVNGAVITDGTAGNKGGNIYLSGSNGYPAALVVNGGEISGGTALQGGGVHLNNQYASATVSGDAKITGNTLTNGTTVSNLYLNTGALLTVGTLTEGAEVGITANADRVVSANTVDSTMLDYLKSDDALKNLYILDEDDADAGKLYLGYYACLCGATDGNHIGECDGTRIRWTAWTSSNSLPTTTGSYYLTGKVSNLGQTNINSDTAQTVTLNLNGFTVTNNVGSRSFLLQKGNTLNIVDHTGKGVIYGGGCNITNCGSLLIQSGSTVNLYSGTVTMRSDAAKTTQGGVVDLSGTSVFNMYGGEITGGTIYRTLSGTSDKGGTGGNIYMTGSAQFNMYAGKITGGQALNDTSVTLAANWGAGGNVFIQGSTVFTMYGGEISGGVSSNHAGNVYVNDGAKFVMNGGEIKNGSTVTGGNFYLKGGATLELNGGTVTGGTATGTGGNIYIEDNDNVASLTIAGATVSNGTAGNSAGNIYAGGAKVVMTSGTVSGGKNTGNKANGGSIYLAGDTTFELRSGTVENGDSAWQGGNFFVAGSATLTVSGGEIKGGNSADGGGNIAANGKVIMTDGSITNGTRKNVLGDNSNLFFVNGDLYMTGGTIDGAVALTSTTAGGCYTEIGGTAKIGTVTDTSGAEQGLSINGYGEASFTPIVLKNLTTGASISLDDKLDTVFTTGTVTAADKAYFVSTNGYQVIFTEEGLKMVAADAIVQCVCGGEAVGKEGHTCYDLVWTEWTSANSLPTTTGNYILTENVELKGASYPVAGAVLNIDLAGHTVTQLNNDRVISTVNRSNVVLSITDSVGGGSLIAASATSTNQGGVIWLSNVATSGNTAGNNTLYLYGGILDGSKYTVTNDVSAGTDGTYGTDDDTTAEKNGGAVCIDGGCTFYMYGGEIVGGTSTNAELNKSGVTVQAEWSAHGASVCVKGTMHMYGGTIRDGKSTGDAGDAGNVYVTGTLNMIDGTIQNGTATNAGGNIRVQGTLNLKGGTITGGTASAGGNLRIQGTVNMSGGLVTLGKATGNGGNITMSGKLYITGGTVSDGDSDTDGGSGSKGGNIYIDGTNAEFTVKNATISGGGHTGRECWGGNIAVNKSGAKVFEIGEGAVITGGKAHRGGNLYIGELTENLNTYKITGGTISGGTASYKGHNICLYTQDKANPITLTIDGGSISLAEGNTNENISLGAGGDSSNPDRYCHIVMNGGSITGGKIRLYKSSTITINGGEFAYSTADGTLLASSGTNIGEVIDNRE